MNNPLGLDEGNKWSAWFKDLELRRVIRQDVQRTYVLQSQLVRSTDRSGWLTAIDPHIPPSPAQVPRA